MADVEEKALPTGKKFRAAAAPDVTHPVFWRQCKSAVLSTNLLYLDKDWSCSYDAGAARHASMPLSARAENSVMELQTWHVEFDNTFRNMGAADGMSAGQTKNVTWLQTRNIVWLAKRIHRTVAPPLPAYLHGDHSMDFIRPSKFNVSYRFIVHINKVCVAKISEMNIATYQRCCGAMRAESGSAHCYPNNG
ncbi:hypothetical protein [Paraburkholderia youngii]|uniref:hypothetical protein n=1 Tax=Paraburkholderia youngii TaxID=2782701 RepID=UPI003D25B962